METRFCENHDKNECNPVARSILRSRVRADLFADWNQRCLSTQKCRQTHEFVPRVNSALTKYIFGSSGLQASQHVQIFTGRNNLLYHLSNIGKSSSSTCCLCHAACETFCHLWSDCPVTARFRWETTLLQGQTSVFRCVLAFVCNEYGHFFAHQ